jgi:hypothetical protein
MEIHAVLRPLTVINVEVVLSLESTECTSQSSQWKRTNQEVDFFFFLFFFFVCRYVLYVQ